MLIAWTWSQFAHEGGTLAAVLIALVCLTYLVFRGASVIGKREQELRNQAIATGLVPAKHAAQKNRRQFRLLDLLVAITLAAALAGLIRGMAYQKEHGMPYEVRGKSSIYGIDNTGQTEK